MSDCSRTNNLHRDVLKKIHNDALVTYSRLHHVSLDSQDLIFELCDRIERSGDTIEDMNRKGGE